MVIQAPDRLERILTVAEKYTNGPIPDQAKDILLSTSNQEDRFNQLLDVVGQDLKPGVQLSTFEIEFVVGLMYPKLDIDVTAQVNHLLKMPFNIHSDTLNICVPIFDFKSFNPEECLNLEDFVKGTSDYWSIKGRASYSFGHHLMYFDKFRRRLDQHWKS